MRITNKAISAKFLNIIIRANHGQTEIVMQYGGLRSSVTCVTTSYSNDSFASPTHRTNQSMDKGLWDVVLLEHKCVTQLLLCFRWILTVANTSTDGFLRRRTRLRVHPNVQLVTDPVIITAKEEHECDSGTESLAKLQPRDILHCHVERRDQSFAVASMAER